MSQPRFDIDDLTPLHKLSEVEDDLVAHVIRERQARDWYSYCVRQRNAAEDRNACTRDLDQAERLVKRAWAHMQRTVLNTNRAASC